MISLLLYVLASLGLSFVVGHSKISLPFRVLLGGRPVHVLPLYKEGPTPTGSVITPEVSPLVPFLGTWFVMLLECPGCLGFWTGIVAFAFRAELNLAGLFVGGSPYLWAIFFGLVTAATNMVGARYLGLIE